MQVASRNFWRLVAGPVVLAALLVLVPAAATQAAATTSKPYIVVLRNSVTDPGVVAGQHGKKYGFQAKFVYRAALKGYAANLSSTALAAINSAPQVAFIEPDATVKAAGECSKVSPPTSDGQCLPNGIDRIDGDTSSAVSGDNHGYVSPVNVAVLDSGIDPGHPDLDVVGGHNCSNGHSFADQNGHGTEVAGVIGALDNNYRVVGVAPGARLWAVRVLNKKLLGSTSSVLCGIDYVTSTRTDADPSNDIAVANMSLGGKGRDDGNCGQTRRDVLHMAICASIAAGVTYVAAAGNASSDIQAFTPASYDEVLTATAIADYDGQPGGLAQPNNVCPDGDDTFAGFSNFATLPTDQDHTVAAPGVCIRTTYPAYLSPMTCPGTQCYITNSGTSFAAPHVSGTVALCIASGPCAGKTPAQIISIITSDAAAYNQANPGYGFAGDPAHSISGQYYGWLIRAGLY